MIAEVPVEEPPVRLGGGAGVAATQAAAATLVGPRGRHLHGLVPVEPVMFRKLATLYLICLVRRVMRLFSGVLGSGAGGEGLAWGGWTFIDDEN